MKNFLSDTYKRMSAQAAAGVAALMKGLAKPLICTASGDSPAGLYKELVKKGF